MRFRSILLGTLALSGLSALGRADVFTENFDSYPPGPIAPQGGWAGWDNNALAGMALVNTTQAFSAPNSIQITGPDDLVHLHSGATFGVWQYRAMQYVPSGMTGQSYFILLNTYSHGGTKNWSLQLTFDASSGLVQDFDNMASTAPLVTDQWVELRVEIDMDNDVQRVYYNGALMLTKSWTNGSSGGGARNVGAVDLFANAASPVFYDDISLCLISADVAFTEIADGVLVGGQPKFVEITNLGPFDVPDLSLFSIGNFNNGGTTLGGGASTVLNAVPLPSGASYVFAYESGANTACDPMGLVSCFEYVYGAPPDQFAGGRVHQRQRRGGPVHRTGDRRRLRRDHQRRLRRDRQGRYGRAVGDHRWLLLPLQRAGPPIRSS